MKPYALITMLLLGAAFSASAETSSGFQFELMDLRSNQQVEVAQAHKKWLLVSFFEEDCRWCLKQLRDLEVLTDQQSCVEAIGVGIGNDRNGLRRWANRASPSIPIYQMGSRLQKTIGKLAATPFTVWYGPNGEIETSSRGYLPLAKLDSIFGQLESCQRNQNRLASANLPSDVTGGHQK